MRLRGIRTQEEANRFLEDYLPLYNRRFSVCPKEGDNFHRPIPKGLALDTILCIKTERSLRNDFTVAHNKKLYQIKDTIKASKVMVQERVDGSMIMTHKGGSLRFKEITERPVREETQMALTRTRKPRIPSVDHPWRRSFKFGIHRYERGKPLEPET